MANINVPVGVAIAIAAAVPANAAVLYDISGVATGRPIPGFDIPQFALDPGAYRITITADRFLVRVNTNAGVEDFYDYYCPGNPPFKCGGNNNTTLIQFSRVSDTTFGSSFRLLPAREFPRDAGILQVYRADRFIGGFTELIDPAIFTGPPTPVPFRLIVESVPEPASWSMMIAGFGLCGAASRRRPTRRALA